MAGDGGVIDRYLVYLPLGTAAAAVLTIVLLLRPLAQRVVRGE